MTTFVANGPMSSAGYALVAPGSTTSAAAVQSSGAFAAAGLKSSSSMISAGPGSKPAPPLPSGGSLVKQCAGCGGDINDRYLLHAIDVYWHTGCLRCSACHAPLADIGGTCFTRAGLILCRNDYLRYVVVE